MSRKKSKRTRQGAGQANGPTIEDLGQPIPDQWVGRFQDGRVFYIERIEEWLSCKVTKTGFSEPPSDEEFEKAIQEAYRRQEVFLRKEVRKSGDPLTLDEMLSVTGFSLSDKLAQELAKEEVQANQTRESRVSEPLADNQSVPGTVKELPLSQRFVPSSFQQGILKALEGKALRTDALAKAVGDRRRLFRDPGGIKELKKHGLVDLHSRLGYFRLDAPPSELVAAPK